MLGKLLAHAVINCHGLIGLSDAIKHCIVYMDPELKFLETNPLPLDAHDIPHYDVREEVMKVGTLVLIKKVK